MTLVRKIALTLSDQIRRNALSCATAFVTSLIPTAHAETLTQKMSASLTASWAGSTQLPAPMTPVGWGYMDPMVVVMDGDQYAPIFFACSDTSASFGCVYIVKNGVIV